MSRSSRSLPRWITFWLPLVVLGVAGAAAAAAFLASRGPEPVGVDTGPIPAASAGRDGVLSFTILSAECGFENVIAEERIPARGQFCLVELEVAASVSGDRGTVNPACQFLITDAGERYVADEEATLAGVERDPFLSGVPPGGSTLELMFDVPADARAVGLELHSACDSEGVRLRFAGTDALRDG